MEGQVEAETETKGQVKTCDMEGCTAVADWKYEFEARGIRMCYLGCWTQHVCNEHLGVHMFKRTPMSNLYMTKLKGGLTPEEVEEAEKSKSLEPELKARRSDE
jgi:hypothetical protein